MITPEARARQNIDSLLAACGWLVQDRAAMNLFAGRGGARVPAGNGLCRLPALRQPARGGCLEGQNGREAPLDGV